MLTDPAMLDVADDDLVADIETALQSSAQIAVLHTVAERLRAHPERLRARLARVLENPARMEALLCRSYRHRNGFTKVKLVETERFSVRLHLWPASSEIRGELNPHGHRWEFASWVVAGKGMREAYYRTCEPSMRDAHAYDLYRYGRTFAARSLWPSARVWLHEYEQFERPGGAVYACPREVVHTVEPIGDGTVVTVVVQGPVVDEDVPVYVRYGGCPRKGERDISVEELRQDLTVIDQHLKRAVAGL